MQLLVVVVTNSQIMYMFLLSYNILVTYTTSLNKSIARSLKFHRFCKFSAGCEQHKVNKIRAGFSAGHLQQKCKKYVQENT